MSPYLQIGVDLSVHAFANSLRIIIGSEHNTSLYRTILTNLIVRKKCVTELGPLS